MRHYGTSIRGLMVVIVLIGLGLVALRTPSRICANSWFSLALGAVTLAIPAAVAAVGERRLFWIGFAVSGGVYFLFALAPWVDKSTSHQLLTTTLLDVASPYIVSNDYMMKSYALGVSSPGTPVGPGPTPWQVWNLPDFQTSDNKSWTIGYVTLHSPFLYLRIGHAAFCLLAAFIGGEVARYVYLRRQTALTDRTPT